MPSTVRSCLRRSSPFCQSLPAAAKGPSARYHPRHPFALGDPGSTTDGYPKTLAQTGASNAVAGEIRPEPQAAFVTTTGSQLPA